MSLRTIPGMDENSLLNTSTEGKGPGWLPFPCNAQNWTRHTAHVVKAELKDLNPGGDENSVLLITVANCQYGGEILIGLDPAKVGPLVKDKEKARQQNLESLLRAVKILGCHTQGKLDTAKIGTTLNQVVEIAAKHKGFREYEGKHYHKVTLVLNGSASEEKDVVEIPMPAPPGLPAPRPAMEEEQDPFFQ